MTQNLFLIIFTLFRPPSGFLGATGALTPVSTPSPFAAILGGIQSSEDIALGPTVESREFRRLVYMPTSMTNGSQGVETIEIEIEETGRKSSVLSRRKIDKANVEVMLPGG